eukprot:3886470-Amphidinium_carterae.1
MHKGHCTCDVPGEAQEDAKAACLYPLHSTMKLELLKVLHVQIFRRAGQVPVAAGQAVARP